MFVNVGGTIVHVFHLSIFNKGLTIVLNENRANDKWIWMGGGGVGREGYYFIQIEIMSYTQ